MEIKVSEEQILQKIGSLVVMLDAQTAQYEQKIKMLEETITELSKGKNA